MKTTFALLVALVLTAISVTALAMPCGRTTRASNETRNSPQMIPLNVARLDPAALKLPVNVVRAPV